MAIIKKFRITTFKKEINKITLKKISLSYNKRQIYIYFEKADALIDLKNNLIIIQNNKDVYKKYTFKQSINDTYDDQMIDFISKLHRKDFKNFVDSNYLPNMIMNLRKSA